MQGSPFDAAFAHNAWATLRIIDACAKLSPEDLQTNVAGTRGPIIDTLRHIVSADAVDLEIATREPAVDADAMSVEELRGATEHIGAAWARFLSGLIDPDEMVREIDDSDGYERTAPLGLRLAGTLEHGTDHRSQICTALTTLGVEPPKIDAMNYGIAAGQVTEKWPSG
jgi:uncharacterized damage-inducible protein DinB